MKYITKQKQDELEKSYGEKFSEWNSDLTGNFTIIPNEILYNNDLTDGEKMFFLKLLGLSNSSGSLYHGNDTLAEKLGCKYDNVAKYLGLLKKKNMLVTLTVGTSTRRVICLTPYNR